LFFSLVPDGKKQIFPPRPPLFPSLSLPFLCLRQAFSVRFDSVILFLDSPIDANGSDWSQTPLTSSSNYSGYNMLLHQRDLLLNLDELGRLLLTKKICFLQPFSASLFLNKPNPAPDRRPSFSILRLLSLVILIAIIMIDCVFPPFSFYPDEVRFLSWKLFPFPDPDCTHMIGCSSFLR